MGEEYYTELCDCCVQAAVNADTSGHDYWCEGMPAPLSELPEGHMVRGAVPDPETMGEDKDEDMWEYATSEFSWRKCGGCGDSFGGRRTTFVVEIMD